MTYQKPTMMQLKWGHEGCRNCGAHKNNHHTAGLCPLRVRVIEGLLKQPLNLQDRIEAL
jgi:hypothetical protein